MARPPVHRRKPNPYAKQVLGVQVRFPIVIQGHALHVLREITAGRYRHVHARGWHLHTPHSSKSTNVDNTTCRLLAEGYLDNPSGGTLTVTAKGLAALDGAL